jgi:hypothetical protein
MDTLEKSRDNGSMVETLENIVDESVRTNVVGGAAVLADVATDAATHAVSGRRRSMSVATGTASVETVVAKAKRAASTLWTLLHSQVGF